MNSCVFVRKDKKAFVGFDMETKQLILNAVGWNRWGVVYRFEYESEKELSLKLDKLNTIMNDDIFVAVEPHAFITGKRYEHFRNKGTLDDTMPVLEENQSPIMVDTDLLFV